MALLSDIQLLELLDNYKAGTCSEAEMQLLQRWFDETDEQERAYQLPEQARQDFNSKMYVAFTERIAQHQRKSKVRSMRRVVAIAASVLIAMLGAYGLYYSIQNETVGSVIEKPITDIAPGRKGALLILADGSTIVLDSTGNGAIATQNGIQVINADGQLSYQPPENADAATIYNTLTTPKARQYNLVLPDGSKVWLNAASSITYPIAFNGADRVVEVTGEAYFEVAHQAKPFKVKVGATEIIDLGTAFNVYAYNDEPTLVATLLQGAIKIQDKVLTPGQQASIKGQAMNILKLSNAEDVIAWKSGNISFDNIDVATLMRQLSRWYDVDIIYNGRVPQERLIGTISRQTNLSTIVKVFNSYDIPCKIEGNKLIVEGR
jgi:ferric-dicitrate binding protein FerR (iron transport regulator)